MRLSKPLAFYLQASILLSFLASSSAPTPLYSVYQAAWGFTPITITVVFGIYALAVLASLLTLGSLSDYVGRKPVLFASTLLQAFTMLLFTFANGVPALMVARVVQGIATGAAIGAVGAGMLDIDRAKGTIANAVAPMTGTAIGGIAAGYLAMRLPAVLGCVGVVYGGGVLPTAREYGLVVIALSVFALLGTSLRRAPAAVPATVDVQPT